MPMMRRPITRRQYSNRVSASSIPLKAVAPTTPPASVFTPPRNTTISASKDRAISSSLGNTLPFENTKSAPASPAMNPATVKARCCTRRPSMPVASAWRGLSRTARSA